jgi:hypothetical protein
MKDEALVLPSRRRASSVKSTARNTITRRLYAENAGLLCAKWIDPQMRGAVEAASTSMGIVVITDYDASPGPRESSSRKMQRFRFARNNVVINI